MASCVLCAGEQSESYLFLKCPETHRWREELLKIKWPEISEEIAIRKILTGKVPLKRELGTLAYNIKCKLGKPTKKAELRLEREHE